MSNLTLFNLTYKVARHITRVVEQTATGGSTTTIVDTNNRTEVNDFWNDGVAWILRDGGGASAAPEGEYSVISDFANSTSTVTLRTTLTAAVASGDRYAICRKEGNDSWLDTLIQSINKALEGVRVPVTDTTSITTASDQTEYSLPIAANEDLREVWLQTDDSDANDNRWVKLAGWRVQQSTTGTADLLIFDTQPPSGYVAKLVYVTRHPDLYTVSSELAEEVPEELVVVPAVLYTYEYLAMTTDNAQKYERQLRTWEERATNVRQNLMVRKPRKTPRFMVLGTDYTLRDTANKVYLG